jgi:2-isopropylmalate synthase
VIEAGFPIASEGDFQAVHEIAKRVKDSVVCGLARAAAGDIDRAGEALQPPSTATHPPWCLSQLLSAIA